MINTTLELRKQLSVQYFEMTKAGLLIDYQLNKVQHTIELDPFNTCRLLKQSGLIDSCEKNGRGVITVSYQMEYNLSDNNGEHIQECRTVYCTFQEFVLQTTFSQYDALVCAIQFERSRQEREAVKNVTNEYRIRFCKRCFS